MRRAAWARRRPCPPAPAPARPAPSAHCVFPALAACRLKSVALVSKRLAALCLAPELLRCVEVDFLSHGERLLVRAEAFLQFHTTHACHIRSLRFTIDGGEDSKLDALVVGWLGAIGAAGALESLSAYVGMLLCSTAWLPALTKLRKLTLSTPVKLRLPNDFSKLTALTDAQLTGRAITAPTLPASLTALHLTDEESPAPPPQVRLATCCMLRSSRPICPRLA